MSISGRSARGLLLAAALLTCGAGPARAQQKDELTPKPALTKPIRKRKLKGAESLPPKGGERPRGPVTVQTRLDLSFTTPADLQGIGALKGQVRSEKDEPLFQAALDFALKPSSAAAGRPLDECCVRVSDGSCWYWCCGARGGDCQDSCRLQYCNAATQPAK